MAREQKRTRLTLPVVLVATVVGAAAAIGAACSGNGSGQVDACAITADDGGQLPCDAGPPDGPLV